MGVKAKTVGILAENDYQTLEVRYPICRLREAGHKPIANGTGSNAHYKSKDGYPVTADRAAGAHWVDEECAVDGNLITARKPDGLPVFARALIDVLGW